MTAVSDLASAKASLVANATLIDAIVNGPATGPTSIVNVNGASVKTVARVAAEMAGLTLDAVAAPAANVSLNSKRITNLADPSSAQDAVTKAYVDAVIQGLTPKPTARLATAAALAACTYANGTAGVGATLTGNANGALSIDGVAVVANDVVLVKDQASGLQNGLYLVTQAGDGTHPFILTRHVDMDSAAETTGGFVPVGNAGTANPNSLWLCNPSGAVTMGTTALPFTQLNAVSTPNYTLASGFANVLRNSTMGVWANGGIGASISIAAAATGRSCIGASGWAVIAAGAAVTAQQDTDAEGASRAMKITGNTSVTGLVIGQRIESTDAAKLAGKRVTIQLAIYNNTGGSITPTIATRYPGAVDDWTSPSADLAATNLQACANGQWTTVAYTLDVHANAFRGYELKVDFGNNFSANTKYVKVAKPDARVTSGIATGLNGSPPTPEIADLASDITRCSRYFQTTYDNGTAPGSSVTGGPFGALAIFGDNAGGAFGQPYQFPVPMRAAPTVSTWDRAGNSGKISQYNGGSWTDNTSGFTILGTTMRGLIAYQSASNANVMAAGSFYSDFW